MDTKTVIITSETVKTSADIQKILDQNRSAETEIAFREGEYYLDAGLWLGKEHNGMRLRGEGKVRLIGGRRLHGWTVAEDARIAPEARGAVLVCNLKENGIRCTGEIASRGYNRPVVPSHSQLFINGELQSLTRYPKGDGFLKISGVAEAEHDEWGEKSGRLEAGFYYDDDRPMRWKGKDDLWVHGYWSWDWANSYERVEELDVAERKIVNAPPYGNYGFKKGQRFCFLNILEELTEPGEYYIDQRENLLYFIPPGEKNQPGMEVMLSLLEEPVLTVENGRDITISGLQVEGTRGNAILVENCAGVAIDNCHIRNIGNHGVFIQGGKGNQVVHSTIHDCGDCGVKAVGGDREALEEADFSICNNHMYRISQWSRCYQPPILMTGVGMTARNNLIHDCPHMAILYWGNDMTIEDNEIYRVVMETGDAGAIYIGKDFTYRGNRVCHNYVHHLGGVGMGTMGVYNDDCVSGTVMEDNYFVETARAVMLGGGRDFVVRNNVFIRCVPGISVDSRGADDYPVWRNMMTRILKERFYHITNIDPENRRLPGEKDISGMDSLYLSRYPELGDIHAYYEKSDVIPGSAVIQGNVFFPQDIKTTVWYSISGERGRYLYDENVFALQEDFRDAAWEDWEIREDARASQKGYGGRSMEGIGLLKELRRENPCQVTTALSVERQGAGSAIRLRVWNREEQAARGTILVETKGKGWSRKRTVEFALEPLERKEYFLNLEAPWEEYEREECILEASSPVPGVRPSICRGMDV